MSRITIVNHVTLDGVMQAPADPDEDRRGGFEHGGWAVPYQDDVQGEYMARRMAAGSGGGLLFGRFTYEKMWGHWGQMDDNPFSASMNPATKFVVSNTLTEPLAWQNTTLLTGDGAGAVAALRADRPDLSLTVLGSGRLGHALIAAGLVDEYVLTIHPLALGQGLRLFPD